MQVQTLYLYIKAIDRDGAREKSRLFNNHDVTLIHHQFISTMCRIIFLIRKAGICMHIHLNVKFTSLFFHSPQRGEKTQTPLDLASIIVKYRRKGWLRPSRAFNE